MSRQQPRPQVAPPTMTRRNEYFLPRNGIDREVISADICRYLGNDALVRPGRYENPQTGQVTEGYYITAYRELTPAMIEDLRRDSTKWDDERRRQTASARHNTSPAQYRLSETHHNRQNYGPSEVEQQQHSFGASSPSGLGGVAANHNKQRLDEQRLEERRVEERRLDERRLFEEAQRRVDERVVFEELQRQQEQYNSSGGNLGHQPQPSPQPPFYHTGVHMAAMNALPPDYSNDYPNEYAGNRMSASAPPQQPIYASSAPSPAGYTATTYPYPAQTASQANGQPYPNMAPQASLVGRVSPATQGPQQSQGYATQGQPPYGNAPISRSSVPPPAPPPSSGANKRRSDRDDDRYPPTDRHARRR